MVRYINPYTDFGFKKLFGEEASKDLLRDFLNQILPPQHQIHELSLHSREMLPDSAEERRAFFDIYCKSASGERFIVELQKAKFRFFKDRALFYSTFPIREQAKRGDWDFRLDPVYFIAILDFYYEEDEERAKFRRDVHLRDQYRETFSDRLNMHFLQMPAFTKTEAELETHLDKWCYFLKHLPEFDHIPAILNEPVFEKAFGMAEIAQMNEEQRRIYEASRLDYLSMKGVIETSREDGMAEGIEKGIGIGRLKEKRELARLMKSEGESVARIARLTGLSEEEIDQL